jgi:hypothetical protein
MIILGRIDRVLSHGDIGVNTSFRWAVGGWARLHEFTALLTLSASNNRHCKACNRQSDRLSTYRLIYWHLVG